MPLDQDSPISQLPEKPRDPGLLDLLIFSQTDDNNTFFTCKATLSDVLSLFLKNIGISDVSLLEQRLASMDDEISQKVSGSHTHAMAEVVDLVSTLSQKASVNHGHTIGQISGLQTALDSKLSTTTHSHAIAQVSGLQAALNQKAALTHQHAINDVSGLISALNAKIDSSSIGVANGVASLDADGKIPASLIDTFEFVVRVSDQASLPATGDTATIYILDDTGECKTWDGSSYVDVSLQLGETDTTAYRGDRGKQAYDHSQALHAPTDAQPNVKSDWNSSSGDSQILNKPSSFPPSTHTHPYLALSGGTVGGNVTINGILYTDSVWVRSDTNASNVTMHVDSLTNEALLTSNPSSGAGNFKFNKSIKTPGLWVTDSSFNVMLTVESTLSSNKVDFTTDASIDNITFDKPIYLGAGTHSKTVNGYTRILNNLLLQWGEVLDDGNTKNFPIAFPNDCFVIVGTTKGDHFTSSSGCIYHVVSSTQFRLRNGPSASDGETYNSHSGYLAIGW